MSRRTHVPGNDWPVLEPMSDAEKLAQVQLLPAPEPGVVVTVPLMLWPVYMQLHGLTPKAFRYPNLLVEKVGQDGLE